MKAQENAVPEEVGAMRSSLAARSRFLSGLGETINRYGLVIAWFLLILAFSIASPSIFLSRANFANIFGSQAVLVVMTMGMIVPLTVGEFDLSMAGLVSTCLMLIGV